MDRIKFIAHGIRKRFKQWQRRRKREQFGKWAKEFAARHDLPYEGILMLAGYRK